MPGSVPSSYLHRPDDMESKSINHQPYAFDARLGSVEVNDYGFSLLTVVLF